MIAARGCASGSNPAYTPSELAHHFTTTGTKFVIAHNDCLYAAIQAGLTSNIPTSNVFSFGPDTCLLASNGLQGQNAPAQETSRRISNVLSAESLLKHEEHIWKTWGNEENVIHETAAYAPTSGTTGLPKAAVISHACLVTQAVMVEEIFEKRSDKASSTHSSELTLKVLIRLRSYSSSACPSSILSCLRWH